MRGAMMKTHMQILLLLAVSLNMLTAYQSRAQESDGSVLTVSKRVGEEIDRREREKYGLFPGIENFVSAKIVRTASDSLILQLVVENSGERTVREAPISPRNLMNLIGQIEFLSDKTKEDLMLEIDKPRFRVSQEIVGHLGALFGGFFALALTLDLGTEFDSRASFYAVWGLGSAFTSSLGVHSHGRFGREAVLFVPTLLGSVIGSGVGILLFEASLRIESAGLAVLGYLFIQPFLTAYGGIKGYNLAVKGRISQAGTGLINFERGKFSFNVPNPRVGLAPGTGRFDGLKRTYSAGLLRFSF